MDLHYRVWGLGFGFRVQGVGVRVQFSIAQGALGSLCLGLLFILGVGSFIRETRTKKTKKRKRVSLGYEEVLCRAAPSLT